MIHLSTVRKWTPTPRSLSVLRLVYSDITRDLRDKLRLCTEMLVVFNDGPELQVSRQITEYLKVTPRRRKDLPAPSLSLCRRPGEPPDLGFFLANLAEYLCATDCAEDCVQQFVRALS